MRTRGLRQTLTWLAFILVLAAGAGYVVWPGNHGIHIGSYDNKLQPSLGLDLRGGIQFIMEAKCPQDAPKCNVSSQMNNVIANLNQRISGGLAINDATVREMGSNRVLIQLPGLTDDQHAKEVLGKTGEMLVIDTGTTPLSVGTDVTGQTCSTTCQTGQYKIMFKGSELDSSAVAAQLDPQTNQPEVTFQFQGAAKDRFSQYTAQNVGKYLTIVLDNQVIESATINSQITGAGQISGGNMTIGDAQQLATYLKYGALPLPLSVASEQKLAATLGEQAIKFGIISAIIGLGLVVIFMLLIYRLPGLLADLALLLYATFLIAMIKILGVTLSLAGIAALILTIGMAVDANILIFERMKEELRAGRTMASAVELGFKRAFPSIRDSNMSTIITCAILYWFGNQFGATIVTGFALNLFIGVAISLFTAITVTRTFLNLLVPTGLATHPALFGLPKEALNVPRYNRPTSRVAAPTSPVLASTAAGEKE
ncbi:MAG TPA: protein translocase subunit SecD [Ktedonobacterales bacterium]